MAEHLHMTVGELCYGRGTPMSAHELTVGWPAYFAYRQREMERQRQRDEQRGGH